MTKRALVLGVGGQDGSYLAEVLLEQGYEVHGMHRRTSLGNLRRIEGIDANGVRTKDKIRLHRGDLTDTPSVLRIIRDVKPHEIYNEADQDNVSWSHDTVGYSCEVTFAAVARLLEVVRLTDPSIRFFQPCTATTFGNSPPPQNENTIFDPQSPYAIAKTATYYLCRYYRNIHQMYVATAIFFNHDSPRRTEDYLLNKICNSAVRIAKGEQETLALGNLDTCVDIGYARDYMETAHRIMQLDKPDDFVIATGNAVSIRAMARRALVAAEVDREKQGTCVVEDPHFYRPEPGPTLWGDIRKAQQIFGFKPKHSTLDVVNLLVEHAREGVLV